MKTYPIRFTPDERWIKILRVVAILGGVIFILGLFFAPERIWPNVLLANYYLLGLGLAGVFFIAIQYVSNAGWAAAIRRVPESMTSVLPVAAVLMLLMIFGIHTLYHWSHESVVAQDHLLQAKSGWLNTPFFIVRIVVYFGLWILFTLFMVRFSRKQDENGDLSYTKKNVRLSAIFLVVFPVTFSLACFDWIMSLEPHWFSTIFAVYNFSGLFLNGIAALTFIVILLRRWGVLQGIVTESHLHDLGKLLFAFSTFWMYIWFSQYILIWYANIPEEVIYFTRRETGSWFTFGFLNLAFNWVFPFILLISAKAKKNEGLLFKACIIVMVGHWIDLFWMILPPFMTNISFVSIWDIGPVAGAIALFFLITFRSLSRGNVIPINDPYLSESLHYHS